MLLTDKDKKRIKQHITDIIFEEDSPKAVERVLDYIVKLDQAQLQKVMEWLEGECQEHEHKYKTIRRYCYECRREMRVEVGFSYHLVEGEVKDES